MASKEKMNTRKETKNARGGGSIRKRPDGRWEARYTVGRDPGTGKQIQKSVYGSTQKEVQQKMQKILVELSEGTYTVPSKLTVSQWLDTWLNGFRASGIASRLRTSCTPYATPRMKAASL